MSRMRHSGFHIRAIKVDDHVVDGSFSPISDNLFVKVNDIPAQTFGGIILPDSSKEKPTEGTVMATGPGKEHPESGLLMKLSVVPGDK
eukprot:gene42216-56073_t